MEATELTRGSHIGACISGGGAKIGFAVGVLEVMEKHGIKIDPANNL